MLNWVLLWASIILKTGGFIRIQGDLSGVDLAVKASENEKIEIRGLQHSERISGDTILLILSSPDEDMITRMGIVKRPSRLELPRKARYDIDLTLHGSRCVFYFDSLLVSNFNLHTEAGFIQLLFENHKSEGGNFTVTGTLSEVEIVNPGGINYDHFTVDCGASRIGVSIFDPLPAPLNLFSTLGSIVIRTDEESKILVRKIGFLNIGPARFKGKKILGTVLFRGSINRIKREVIK